MVSGEQWRDSAVRIHVHSPPNPLPSRLPQNIEQSSMCSTVGPCWLFILNIAVCTCPGLPQWLTRKEPTCNAGDAGDMGLIPGLGWSPGGGHGNPLQYPCLENPMDRGPWLTTVHWVAESDLTEATAHTHTCPSQTP